MGKLPPESLPSRLDPDLRGKAREHIATKPCLDRRLIPHRKPEEGIDSFHPSDAVGAHLPVEAKAGIDRPDIGLAVRGREVVGGDAQASLVHGAVTHDVIGQDPWSQPVLDGRWHHLLVATTRLGPIEDPVEGLKDRMIEGLKVHLVQEGSLLPIAVASIAIGGGLVHPGPSTKDLEEVVHKEGLIPTLTDVEACPVTTGFDVGIS